MLAVEFIKQDVMDVSAWAKRLQQDEIVCVLYHETFQDDLEQKKIVFIYAALKLQPPHH